jgi:hypothetical protein
MGGAREGRCIRVCTQALAYFGCSRGVSLARTAVRDRCRVLRTRYTVGRCRSRRSALAVSLVDQDPRRRGWMLQRTR